jgi:type VI secretion system secreted protein Hcp
MPVFMYYPNVTGDVTSEGYAGWIQLDSWHWGTARDIGNAASSGADREGSAPIVHEITLTKDNDCATPTLIQASLGMGGAAEGQEVKIDFCKTDAEKPEPYFQLTLTNTLISSLSMSTNGDDRPSETLTLNFTAIEFRNTPMGGKNDTGTPVSCSYDLTKQSSGK